MTLTNKVKAIPLSVIDASTLTANYQAINPGGLTSACFFVRINNDSDEGAIISYDGVIAHEFLEAGGVLQLPLQTNSGPTNRAAYLPQGSIVYVKEATTAGTGDIYLSGYYQPQGV